MDAQTFSWIEIAYNDQEGNENIIHVRLNNEVFEDLNIDPSIMSQSGEQRIDALYASYGSHISAVIRYTNGELNDGPEGQPAYVMYKNGDIYSNSHWRSGRETTSFYIREKPPVSNLCPNP